MEPQERGQRLGESAIAAGEEKQENPVLTGLSVAECRKKIG